MTTKWLDTLTDTVAGALARRTSRRGFLARAAVVGTAVAVDPVNYVLRPADAYTSVCGDGASCSSGWTAFCVTINKGANTCPPGSFIGGWWKADNASVCGGHARYYIDCNASCVNGQYGHYTCSCRCSGSTTCDQRRTCCNQFRYGQCSQSIHCYGPVVCRVISCVPPWHWAACTSTSATDNRTLNHSAPALPHSYDAIERRYTSLGGPGSKLGYSLNGRHTVSTGLQQDYLHGLLAWSPHTPASMLLVTAAAYRARGGGSGILGFPTGDERTTDDAHARIVHTQHGVLWSNGTTSAHSLNGAWTSRWAAMANNPWFAGHPTSNVVVTHDGHGRIGKFATGCLLWSSTTGAHYVNDDCYPRYQALKWEQSPLGYPISDTVPVGDGVGHITTFQHGAIAWSHATGAWDVSGVFYGSWHTHGGPTGELGYPKAAAGAAAVSGATKQVFTKGDVLNWSAGTFAVAGAVFTQWTANGAEAGTAYGLPTADAVTTSNPDGTKTTAQPFEHGVITITS